MTSPFDHAYTVPLTLPCDPLARSACRPCRPCRPAAGARLGAGGERPCSSPPVSHTARSHTPAWSTAPNRSPNAQTASIIASTASPSSLPAGVTAPRLHV